MNDRLNEIRARWAEHVKWDVGEDGEVYAGDRRIGSVDIGGAEVAMAHAPEDVAWLVAEVARLRAVLEHAVRPDVHAVVRARRDEALAEVARLEQLVCDWQGASGLERGGDPSAITPADCERNVQALLAEVTRLRAERGTADASLGRLAGERDAALAEVARWETKAAGLLGSDFRGGTVDAAMDWLAGEIKLADQRDAEIVRLRVAAGQALSAEVARLRGLLAVPDDVEVDRLCDVYDAVLRASTWGEASLLSRWAAMRAVIADLRVRAEVSGE